MSKSKEAFMEDRELNLFLQPKEEIAVLPIENKRILTSDKADLSLMASVIVEGVTDGNADAMDTYLMAKKGLYVFTQIVEALKDKVPAPSEKDYKKHNCDIRTQMTGVSYSYDLCNDPIWNDLASKLADIKQKMDTRQTWLKSFSKPTEVEEQIDEETGEVIMEARKINPPVKMGNNSLIVSIK